MAVVSVRELLEAGVHFGHESRRWNPKMRPYIFEERNGVHIIDLHQTAQQFEEAYAFIRQTVASGKTVLFVGTKRQAKESVREAAARAGMYCVTERWLGGLLTNFKTVRKSIGRLTEIDRLISEGIIDRLPKKEVSSLKREKAKLERNLMGIKEMSALPGAMFVIDPKRERIAVAEGRRLGIPIVAVVDTNGDPEEIDFPVVGNDESIKAVKLMADKISQACAEGIKMRSVPEEEAKKPRGRRAAEAPAPEKVTPAVEPEAPAVEQAEASEEPAAPPVEPA